MIKLYEPITLHTLEDANTRQVFEQAKEHMLKQNKRAGKPGHCLYRSPEGLKCAVGCFITDDEYLPEFEDVSADHLAEVAYDHFDACVGKGLEKHVKLLSQLQRIHDTVEVSQWASAFDFLERTIVEHHEREIKDASTV